MESESTFIILTTEEVNEYFIKLCEGDELFGKAIAYNFISYNKYHAENGTWTVHISKTKRVPMKDWKGAARTWMRNLKRYNYPQWVKLQSLKIFKD